MLRLATSALRTRSALTIKAIIRSESALNRHPLATIRFASATAATKLRPYQLDSVKSCLSAIRLNPYARIGISLPPAAGKTLIALKVVDQILSSPGNEHKKVLWLMNGPEMVHQTADVAFQQLQDKMYGIGIEQSCHHAEEWSRIIVASAATLWWNGFRRFGKEVFDPKLYALVVIDEAQEAVTENYLRLLHRYNRDIKLPAEIHCPPDEHKYRIPILGLSGTFAGTNGVALNQVFDKIVYQRTVTEQQAEGWMPEVKRISVPCPFDLSRVSIKEGEYHVPELCNALVKPDLVKMTVKAYMVHASDRRSTLVFAAGRKHAEHLYTTFRNYGIDARIPYVEYAESMDREERLELLEDDKQGKFPVLVTGALYKQGIDVPQVDCVLTARPYLDSRNFRQVAAGFVSIPNKKDCLILNMVSEVDTEDLGSLEFSANLEGREGLVVREDLNKSPVGFPKGQFVEPFLDIAHHVHTDAFSLKRMATEFMQRMGGKRNVA